MFQCPFDRSCLFLPGFPLEGMKVVRLRGIKRRDPVSHEVLASLLLALRRHLERNATLIIKLMCKSIQKFSLRLLEDYISSQKIVRQCIFLHARIVKCNIYEHNDICTGYPGGSWNFQNCAIRSLGLGICSGGLVIRSIELNITFSTRPSIKTIRSLGLSNLFSRIEIRTNGFNRGNDLELQNELFKSIAVREKEFLYSRDRIAYPWKLILNPRKRIAQFDIMSCHASKIPMSLRGFLIINIFTDFLTPSVYIRSR